MSGKGAAERRRLLAFMRQPYPYTPIRRGEPYQHSLGGRVPPVLDGLTGDQRFFASFATIWAGKTREGSLMQALTSDTHAPSDFRVRGALANHDVFYSAFGVHEGDAMFVPPAQRVKLW